MEEKKSILDIGPDPQLIRLEEYPPPLPLFDLLRMIIHWAIEMIAADAGEIFLWDPVSQELVLAVSSGFLERYIGTRLKPGEGISGKAFLLDKALLVEDYNNWEGKPAAFIEHPPNMDVMAVPMHWQEHIIGVLVVDTNGKVKRFTKDDMRMVNVFANVASAAIIYERFYHILEKKTNQVKTLTPREKEIVKLLLEGLSNPEIAEQLVISRSTVKVHVSHILEKLDVDTRVDVIKLFTDLPSSEAVDRGGTVSAGPAVIQ